MLTAVLLLTSLISTSHAQSNDGTFNNGGGWRGSYFAGIVIAIIAAVVIFLSCCLISRRRRFARTVNPAVKPPIFGTAPPGYSLPFWNSNTPQVPPAQYGADNVAGAEGAHTGRYQYPLPAAQAPSDPPPPPYVLPEGKGPYAPPPGPPPQAHTHADFNSSEIHH